MVSLLIPALASCQTSAGNTSDGLSQSGIPLPLLPLGPDDLLTVNVLGVPALSKPIRVGEDGSIRIPMVDKPIAASGKLPADLESDIAEALRHEDLVREPLVTVTVTEYVSRQVTVAGAVRNPTTVQAVTNMTLLEAITRAGGFAEDAGAELTLNSRADAGSLSVRRIAIKGLMNGSDDQSNPIVHPGDEIRVPRAPRIFILGNVRKPGSIALVETSGSSVMKAIAMTDGLAPFATNEAWIFRQNPGAAEREQIQVHLAAIMNRKSPDVDLKADDIFYVPDNKTKRITADVLDRLVSFGSATTSGMLIWRR
jgi:polysaccharide biosynthesis/export protein